MIFGIKLELFDFRWVLSNVGTTHGLRVSNGAVCTVLVFRNFGMELVVADLPFVKTVRNDLLDEI